VPIEARGRIVGAIAPGRARRRLLLGVGVAALLAVGHPKTTAKADHGPWRFVVTAEGTAGFREEYAFRSRRECGEEHGVLERGFGRVAADGGMRLGGVAAHWSVSNRRSMWMVRVEWAPPPASGEALARTAPDFDGVRVQSPARVTRPSNPKPEQRARPYLMRTAAPMRGAALSKSLSPAACRAGLADEAGALTALLLSRDAVRPGRAQPRRIEPTPAEHLSKVRMLVRTRYRYCY
jgi:hypothetical protein